MAVYANDPLMVSDSSVSLSQIPPATRTKDGGEGYQILDNRKRSWAPRVRTGCLTCRKRHVKCDETKPMCLKCVGARKECVYFRTVPPASAVRRSLHPAPVVGTVQELSLSKYFMGNVITFLADEFNGDLWQYSLPQMMHNAEAIWHGSNAIASLSLSHRAIDDGSAKESTRQYSMSMKHILGITQSPYITPQNKAIVLLANVLYGVYALFTGDTVANMTLHEKTRRLIRHWRFWECTEAAPVSALAMHLLHHFLKSSTLRQEALFISPEPPGQTWIEAITWFQKRPIRSINQAYVEFEMMWISVRATLDNIPFRPTRKDILVADAGRSVLRQQFESWALRYRAFKSARAPISLHASILKVRSILINILFKLDLDSAENLWDETCWDAFDIEFAAAFRALQAALGKENKAARRAEFDTQFTPSLYKALTFITRTCRRPVLRRDAIALLRTSLGVATGRLSRITGNPVMEFIADQIIDVEEVAWRDAKSRDDCAEGSKCVKDKFICNMHRIARVVAPREIPERIVNYTLLTTGDILNGREGHRESVRAVFFS